ncbi:hypothetical protein BDZ89DRAFT_1020165 [Hymenopellis radicata]|nr:hypothetical protein BDZ89DRAFT_1020165 [Hymenopellis radicata]
MSVFSNFAALDELIQVIYQNIEKYVVLSNVSDDNWTIHVGQAEQGRWWLGRWTEDDVTKLVGSNASDILLETFAEKLADSIVKGELYVQNPDSSDISLVLAPSSKKPMKVPLAEMDAAQAAVYTTRTLIEIALNAQKRKCQLNPMDFATDPLPTSSYSSRPTAGPSKKPNPSKNDAESSASEAAPLERKRKDLPVVQKEKPGSNSKPVAKPPRAVKGASLANPNKKARKYQAIEFGSDDE